MAAMLVLMMAIIVVTGIVSALHPSSNVEVVDPLTLHLHGEFVESNLGTAVEPDGSVTVRIIAEQYEFVPRCVRVPAATPVTSKDPSTRETAPRVVPSTPTLTLDSGCRVAESTTVPWIRPTSWALACAAHQGHDNDGYDATDCYHTSVLQELVVERAVD
jgi:cytochrome c oxidase subunit 2